MIKKIIILCGLILILQMVMQTTMPYNFFNSEVYAQNYTNEEDPTDWTPCPICHCRFSANGDCCCGGVEVFAAMPCFCLDCLDSYICEEGHTCPSAPESGGNEPVVTYTAVGGGGSYYQFNDEIMDIDSWLDYILNHYSIFNPPAYILPGGVNYVTTTIAPTPTVSGSIIASKTLSFLGGQYTRGTERPVTLQSTVFDCSAWVHFVLLNLDPTLANNLGTNTATIDAYCVSHGNYHSKPKIGDLAVWAGHVEFVVDYNIYGGYVTINGSRGGDGSPVPSSIGAGWLTYTTMYRIAPNFKGFWTVH